MGLIHVCTKRRYGKDENSRGSGRPKVTCMHRIAAKCVLIDPGVKPSMAIAAANSTGEYSILGIVTRCCSESKGPQST